MGRHLHALVEACADALLCRRRLCVVFKLWSETGVPLLPSCRTARLQGELYVIVGTAADIDA